VSSDAAGASLALDVVEESSSLPQPATSMAAQATISRISFLMV
jgi:hypothetical protein